MEFVIGMTAIAVGLLIGLGALGVGVGVGIQPASLSWQRCCRVSSSWPSVCWTR
jgi:hypothetical protein